MNLDWMGQGSCRAVGTDFMFPDAHDAGAVQEAKAVCQWCTVREPCLEFAMRLGWACHGVWGGTTREERGLMFPEKGIRCGTTAGYNQHVRAFQEEPCDACRAAYNSAAVKRRRRKEEAQGKTA